MLLHAVRQPAFERGEFYGLNHSNKENPAFGRLDGETVSGHWLYAFLRHDAASGQSYLVVANFHPEQTLRGVTVRIPDHARKFLGRTAATAWALTDKLAAGGWSGSISAETIETKGVALPEIPPCSALMLEISGVR